MINEVVIKLRTTQKSEDTNSLRALFSSGEDTDVIDFITDGIYSYEDGTGMLRYVESSVTGLEGTTTTVYLNPEAVVVDREGSLTSRMVFSEGHVDRSLYETAFGSMEMNLVTNRMDVRFGPGGGTAEIDYEISCGGRRIGKNKFSISVEESDTGIERTLPYLLGNLQLPPPDAKSAGKRMRRAMGRDIERVLKSREAKKNA